MRIATYIKCLTLLNILMTCTLFSHKVYALTKQIPQGKVSTYKAIAHTLGTTAYRAVGNALHRNPYAPDVPCHRVISSSGDIGGFARDIMEKKVLLQSEGVVIKNNMINLERYFHPFLKKEKGHKVPLKY